MEKTISVEERIRRAEEIYARRRNDDISTSISYARVPVSEKKKSSPLKKMFIQICICVFIYVGLYMMKSGEYIFSAQFIEELKNILEYDMNIQNMGEDILNYINDIRNKDVIIPEENQAQEVESETVDVDASSITETITETTNEEHSQEQQEVETLGLVDEPLFTEDASSISQIQIDSDYIKQNYSFIKPLEGTITSRFGNRNPTTETVPKYHTGIDIARVTGTKIIAAMEGEVTLVSSSGDYRKSFKNCEW